MNIDLSLIFDKQNEDKSCFFSSIPLLNEDTIIAIISFLL